MEPRTLPRCCFINPSHHRLPYRNLFPKELDGANVAIQDGACACSCVSIHVLSSSRRSRGTPDIQACAGETAFRKTSLVPTFRTAPSQRRPQAFDASASHIRKREVPAHLEQKDRGKTKQLGLQVEGGGVDPLEGVARGVARLGHRPLQDTCSSFNLCASFSLSLRNYAHPRAGGRLLQLIRASRRDGGRDLPCAQEAAANPGDFAVWR